MRKISWEIYNIFSLNFIYFKFVPIQLYKDWHMFAHIGGNGDLKPDDGKLLPKIDYAGQLLSARAKSLNVLHDESLEIRNSVSSSHILRRSIFSWSCRTSITFPVFPTRSMSNTFSFHSFFPAPPSHDRHGRLKHHRQMHSEHNLIRKRSTRHRWLP